jgi:type VI secretion system VgrG family protein
MPATICHATLETLLGRLDVIALDGHEAIGVPYRFALSLRSRDPALDGAAILQSPVTLELAAAGVVQRIHGVVQRFEQGDAIGAEFGYHAVLVPRVALLGLGRESQIYQHLSVPEIVMAVLARSGLMDAGEIDLRLERDHPRRRYVVQFQESNLAFIMRLLEDAAIGMAFEHDAERERLVLCDENRGFAERGRLRYRGRRTKGSARLESLRLVREALPAQLLVQDHDDRAPHLPLEGRALIDPLGVGLYADPGTRFDDPRQGPVLAKLRAEELRARATTLRAVSEAPLGSGVRTPLEGHFRDDVNQPLLVTEVRHELAAGVYRAHACAVFADVPFRPARVTPKPRLHGAMHAQLDASGPDEMAAIDAEGRYRVVMPFDQSGADEGQASAPMPLAHPYGTEGLHIPLPKGAEVVWTCLDGDPDRPILTGTIPPAFPGRGRRERARAAGPRVELRAGPRAPALSAQQHASTTFVDTAGQTGSNRTDRSGDDTWFKIEVPHTARASATDAGAALSYLRYGEQPVDADDGPRAVTARRDWLAGDDGLQLNDFSGTAARITSGNAQSFALTAGDQLKVKVDAGSEQTVTFSKLLSAAEVAAAINAAFVSSSPAAAAAGQVTLTSPTTGTSSTVTVSGTAAAALFATTSATGTASPLAAASLTSGNESFDIGGKSLTVTIDGGAPVTVTFTWNATAAEVANQINATLNGGRAIAESDGKVTILSGTKGTTSKLEVTGQPSGSGNMLAFASGEQSGTDSIYNDAAPEGERAKWQTSGMFDYTDRNRTVVTRGNYEELIGGSAWRTVHGTNRFVIKQGGLGVRDASTLYFKDMKKASDGTWYNREVSHAATVSVTWGDTQTYSTGYKYDARLGFDNSVFIGLQTSCTLALTSSISATASVAVNTGAHLNVALEGSWSTGKTWTCTAQNEIKLQIDKSGHAIKRKLLAAAALGTAAVGAGVAVLGSAISAGAAASEAKDFGDGADSDTSDAATALENARNFGIAAGPVMAVAGLVTAALAIKSVKKKRSSLSKGAATLEVRENEILLQVGKSQLHLTASGAYLGFEGSTPNKLARGLFVKADDVSVGNFSGTQSIRNSGYHQFQ